MSADTAGLRDAFERSFGRAAEVVAEAPGRVNLIGEHTDYNEGFVFPVAVDRTVAVAAAPRDDALVRVHALDLDDCDEFPLSRIGPSSESGWRNYVRGVAWSLAEAGHRLRGADLAITGDVSRAAGLSSSAALEVAVAGALAAVAGIEIKERKLARLAQRAENEFVGVQCGIMDQMAAVMGRAGHAFLIDCRSLETKSVPLGEEMAIVVVDSGVRRDLNATPYNERRRECAQAAEALTVRSLRDADAEMLEGAQLQEPLYRRARHVISENARVLRFAEALSAGDLEAVGALMYESHASLRDDFEASRPELDVLVELARGSEGVIGARLTGAGFGGCTVNLVRRDAVETFERRVGAEYRSRTGREARMHVCLATDGLRVSRA